MIVNRFVVDRQLHRRRLVWRRHRRFLAVLADLRPEAGVDTTAAATTSSDSQSGSDKPVLNR
jgi:hypothetical protein